jgi:hypothetical protein
MKSTFKKFITVVILTTCIIWIDCGKDNPVDSNDTVANTDFVAEKSFSFQVGVEDHSQLRLEAINGNIAITGIWDSDSVLITGKKRVGSESIEDAEEHLINLEVRVQDLGNEIFVKTIQPEKTYGRDYVVNYTMTLPKDLKVLASSVNGSVAIDSINDDVTISNVNGLITLDEIFGNAFVTLTNGEIDGEVILPLNGTITMTMVNGNIDLHIPANTSAEFSAAVTNGNIKISNLYLKDQTHSPTSLEGTLGEGQGTISLITVNGNISVWGF